MCIALSIVNQPLGIKTNGLSDFSRLSWRKPLPHTEEKRRAKKRPKPLARGIWHLQV